MPETRSELLIKKVFESNFTWGDLENYFNINRDFLLDELKSFLSLRPQFNLRLKCVSDQLALNEKNHKQGFEYV